MGLFFKLGFVNAKDIIFYFFSIGYRLFFTDFERIKKIKNYILIKLN
jgi:hypothetical protein